MFKVAYLKGAKFNKSSKEINAMKYAYFLGFFSAKTHISHPLHPCHQEASSDKERTNLRVKFIHGNLF
jgi:hypothetical protein